MRPLLHASLVNDRYGDPAVYVETLFEKHALLFDLGDISALPPRKIQRIEQAFISHAHIDHFFGFDLLLRMLVGRDKIVHVFGPEGLIDRVGHKLKAYQWNLVDRFLCDLIFDVSEIDASGLARAARFRLKNAFAKEKRETEALPDGLVCDEPSFQVAATVLEHRIPCIAFTLQERLHVNIWKNRLKELHLPVGPWLHELKRAVTKDLPDDHLIEVPAFQLLPGRQMTLGDLRAVLTVTPGQKIGYVTDAADTPANREAIVDLVHGADLLFIEAAFAAADTKLAKERAHLTTKAAGEIARAAGVRRVEPFHFSPRYEGEGERMIAEVMAAFSGA
ncbi:MAG: MBL fold metallo-hydrolase [Methyloceanibacter sp.]|jgi:ribonuclease Z